MNVSSRQRDLPTAVAPANLRVMPRGVPRHRVVLTALLSLFLLFLQQESVRHALDHIGARIERSKHSALELPTGDVCLECELLAAGTSATPPAPLAVVGHVAAWVDIVIPPANTATRAPSFYQSRAPPYLLQHA